MLTNGEDVKNRRKENFERSLHRKEAVELIGVCSDEITCTEFLIVI